MKSTQLGHLATKLKDGTKQAHEQAESVGFVRKFRRGEIPRGVYAQLLQSLYFIYEAMEQELARAVPKSENLQRIYFPRQLNRVSHLVEDLQFFYGDNWRSQMHPSPVTQRYVKRLKECAHCPDSLIAHAYTRYLGDLSGGQILKRLAIRNYKLPNNKGTSFFDFPHVENIGEFKTRYRQKLDEAALPRDMIEKIVSEANVAFQLNTELFLELDPPTHEHVHTAPKTEEKTPPAKGACPFHFTAGKSLKRKSDEASDCTGSKPENHFFLRSQMLRLAICLLCIGIILRWYLR